MTILNPLYLSTVSAIVNGEEQSAGQIIADNRKAEGIRATLVRAITECPAYEGAHQLTAFSKKRFGDPAESAEAAAMKQAWDANVAYFAEYYLSEGERHAITHYADKMREMRQQYKDSYISELLKSDSALAAKRKESEDAAGKLSSFMNKVRVDLVKYDQRDAPQEKKVEVKTPEAKDARDLYNLISRENNRKDPRWTGAQYDALYGMLESLKKDPTAKYFLDKLSK